MGIDFRIKPWLAYILLVSFAVPTFCQNIQLKQNIQLPSVVNLNFFVADNAKPAKNEITSGRMLNMSCEIHFDFDDTTSHKILSGIDSIRDASNELIGNCYNSNGLYDSYLLLHHPNGDKTKVVFLCKDYSQGLISRGDSRFFLIFTSEVATLLELIAGEIRASMFPCKGIETKK